MGGNVVGLSFGLSKVRGVGIGKRRLGIFILF